MSKCSHHTRSTKGRMKLSKKQLIITCAQPVGWRDSLNTRQREYGHVIPIQTLWKLARAGQRPFFLRSVTGWKSCRNCHCGSVPEKVLSSAM